MRVGGCCFVVLFWKAETFLTLFQSVKFLWKKTSRAKGICNSSFLKSMNLKNLKQKVRNMESFFSPRRIWPSSYYLQVLKQVISTWTNYWKRVPWVEPCYPIMVMSTVAQERGLKTLTFKIKEVVDLFLADYFFWLYYYQFFVFSKLLFLFFLIFLIGRLRDCKTVLANSSMWMYLDESTY